MSKLKINLGKQKFKIGDEVSINLKKKGYEGKSIRRRIIDSLLSAWRMNSLDNLGTEVERNFVYKFSSTKDTLKVFKDILEGKRSCENSIFKRHEDSKEWFKCSIEALDNFEGAIVIGVEASYHQVSKISPCHVSYVEGNNRPLYLYKVLIHGLCDNKKNHVLFEIELFDEDMKLLK